MIYGYATGVFSSRGLARKLEEDVAFRVLAAGNFPSHDDLRVSPPSFGGFQGAVCGGGASGARDRPNKVDRRDEGSSQRQQAQGDELRSDAGGGSGFGEIESRARETDAAPFQAHRGDELPEELRRREDRLAAIRAARARLEARQREADEARGREPSKRNRKGGRPYKREYGEPDEKAQDNFTVPKAGMKTSSEGFQQCYNAQVAVEGEKQLIVATEVSSNASDQGRLVPLVDEVEATHGERPRRCWRMRATATRTTLRPGGARRDGYVALGREGRRAVAVDAARHPAKARMAEKWRPRRDG